MKLKVGNLLSGVTSTGAGVAAGPAETGFTTFQATVSGTGAVSATVIVQVSNDGTNWLDLATFTLSGTTSASDGFAAEAPWKWFRGNVTAISGTGAAVDLIVAAGG